VDGANFHVTGTALLDSTLAVTGASTFTGTVTLPASTTLTTPTITSPVLTGISSTTPQALTVADSGDGSAATATLTPTSNVVLITCSDSDGCTITMGETGMVSGMVVRVVNMSANACAFADTSGVSETTGSISLGQYDSLSFVYASDRWVELGASNN
jgi:hypothetical protein